MGERPVSRPGWNAHGWWIGPPELEPERKPPKARCKGPKLCPQCTEKIKWYAPDPEGLPVTECNFCHGAIIWAETIPNPNARTVKEPERIPFDAEDDSHGRWALTPRAGKHPLCGEMKSTKADAYRAAGRRTFQRHVKTCPKVADWPKGKFIVAARTRKATP
jgi:hypothetical protein